MAAERPSSQGSGSKTLPGGDAVSESREHIPADAEKGTGQEEQTAATDGDSSRLVWWDGDSDPENPFNWPRWQKVTNCACISAVTFVTPLASSIFAPSVPALMRDFGETNQLLASFVVSVYILGFAFGPLLIAPLSEIYGRLPVYHVCNVGFIAFNVGCALAPTFDALIVFRFFAGTFGSCPLTNGGGSIADMIVQEKRAAAMAVFSMGPLVGPVLGPVVGGALQDAKGWRWNFWVLVIISGFLSGVMLLSMRETYAPVILARKTKRLQKETGDMTWRSKLDDGRTSQETFSRAIVRPMKMLIFSPICTIFALYIAMVYGYLYILFTSVPFVFQRSYGFSATNVGLVYLGLGVGSFLGMGWFTYDTSREIRKKKELGEVEAEQNKVNPEVRLRLLPLGALFLPIGFFIYGWTTDYRTHWMGPVIGLGIVGVGNLICLMAVSMYLIDTYTLYAASALAANTVVRSIAGAVLPLCALDMYDALGLGWGNSLLGFIAVACLPVPILILRYGERLRNKFDPKRL